MTSIINLEDLQTPWQRLDVGRSGLAPRALHHGSHLRNSRVHFLHQIFITLQCCGNHLLPFVSQGSHWNPLYNKRFNQRHCHLLSFFPRASERRVLPIVGVCISSSHLHIFSSSHLLIFISSHLLTSHLHIFSSSHLLIFTSSHLHIFSSSHLLTSHLLIFTSSHLHIFSSSHLHIFTSSHLHIFKSSQLLIFTSSHLLIFISSHPHIFTSSHPHIFTSSHLHIFSSCPLALLPSCSLLLFYFSSEGGGRGSANETARNATFSHETRFDRQKLR